MVLTHSKPGGNTGTKKARATDPTDTITFSTRTTTAEGRKEASDLPLEARARGGTIDKTIVAAVADGSEAGIGTRTLADGNAAASATETTDAEIIGADIEEAVALELMLCCGRLSDTAGIGANIPAAALFQLAGNGRLQACALMRLVSRLHIHAVAM